MAMGLGGFFKGAATGLMSAEKDRLKNSKPGQVYQAMQAPQQQIPMNGGVPQDNAYGDFPVVPAPPQPPGGTPDMMARVLHAMSARSGRM